MDVAVGLVRLDSLRRLGQVVQPHRVAIRQSGHHRLDTDVVLPPLMLLQGGHQLFQLGESLLVVDRQQHPGLDIHQLGRHGDELAGHLQVQLPPLVHPGQILVQNQGDLNVLDLHLVLAQQMEDQVQGAVEVLHILPVLDHFFQMVNGRFDGTHLKTGSE